jgi:hypothetical protein
MARLDAMKGLKEDVAEVLRRRLFKTCDPAEMRTNPITAFKGVCVHDEALKREGAAAEKTFVESYPFHPFLTNILYSNWTGLRQFQRTRGVLRLFAMALRDAAKWDTSPLVGRTSFSERRANLACRTAFVNSRSSPMRNPRMGSPSRGKKFWIAN